MIRQTIHLSEADHNTVLVACQHPAATDADRVFLSGVAASYVACERISRDDYHRLQAILRRLDGAQAAPTTTPAPVEAGATLLEQPQYAGLLEIITGEWGYALHKSLNPNRAWLEIQQRLAGMSDYALLLNHDDAAFEELRALSSLALEHRLNSEVRHG